MIGAARMRFLRRNGVSRYCHKMIPRHTEPRPSSSSEALWEVLMRPISSCWRGSPGDED